MHWLKVREPRYPGLVASATVWTRTPGFASREERKPVISVHWVKVAAGRVKA